MGLISGIKNKLGYGEDEELMTDGGVEVKEELDSDVIDRVEAVHGVSDESPEIKKTLATDGGEDNREITDGGQETDGGIPSSKKRINDSIDQVNRGTSSNHRQSRSKTPSVDEPLGGDGEKFTRRQMIAMGGAALGTATVGGTAAGEVAENRGYIETSPLEWAGQLLGLTSSSNTDTSNDGNSQNTGSNNEGAGSDQNDELELTASLLEPGNENEELENIKLGLEGEEYSEEQRVKFDWNPGQEGVDYSLTVSEGGDNEGIDILPDAASENAFGGLNLDYETIVNEIRNSDNLNPEQIEGQYELTLTAEATEQDKAKTDTATLSLGEPFDLKYDAPETLEMYETTKVKIGSSSENNEEKEGNKIYVKSGFEDIEQDSELILKGPNNLEKTVKPGEEIELYKLLEPENDNQILGEWTLKPKNQESGTKFKVTPPENTEEALEANNQRLQEITKYIPDGVDKPTIRDVEGYEKTSNPQVFEDYSNSSIYDGKPKASSEFIFNGKLTQVIAYDNLEDKSLEELRSNGSSIWNEVKISGLPEENIDTYTAGKNSYLMIDREEEIITITKDESNVREMIGNLRGSNNKDMEVIGSQFIEDRYVLGIGREVELSNTLSSETRVIDIEEEKDYMVLEYNPEEHSATEIVIEENGREGYEVTNKFERSNINDLTKNLD